MRGMLAIIFALTFVFFTGCGGNERPPPPEGYVDPGTDPGAMGAELNPNLRDGAAPAK